MGGEGRQWLIVRNARGQQMLDLLGDEIELEAPGDAGKRSAAVKGFIGNVERAAGGLPLRRMPDWLRPIMGWLMPRVGPRGLEVARTRVEMKAAETVIHLRRGRHVANVRGVAHKRGRQHARLYRQNDEVGVAGGWDALDEAVVEGGGVKRPAARWEQVADGKDAL